MQVPLPSSAHLYLTPLYDGPRHLLVSLCVHTCTQIFFVCVHVFFLCVCHQEMYIFKSTSACVYAHFCDD